jgi:hypothetical protein
MAALALAMLAVPATPSFAASAPRVLFPTDRLTVHDGHQVTGRRVTLPLPDCGKQRSACDDIRLANRLDGFDVDPRIAIRFDRKVNLKKAQAGITLRLAKGGKRIGVDRLVWDSKTRTLYLHPAKQLQESRTYRIDVSTRIAGRFGTGRFTTMSTTATLRRMVQAIGSGAAYSQAGIAAADRGLKIDYAVEASTVTGLRRNIQTTTGGPLQPADVPNTATANAGLYVFGSFQAPGWEAANRTMAATPTERTPAATSAEQIGFALIVPAGAPPAGGWPVAIFGHGFGSSKYDVFLAADQNAARGVATIAIDAAGHGGGPTSTLDVTTAGGTVKTVPSYGRSRDTDGDGNIGFFETFSAPLAPDKNAAVQLRDGLRQTALDIASLTQAIGRGVDLDGNGTIDLSQSRIGYYGQSLGGIYGTMAVAADPHLEYGLLNVPGGPISDVARLSPSFRAIVTQYLGASRPSLLNGPGGGFTEDQPLPGDPPVAKPAGGSLAIQDAFAMTNWIDRSGSPEAYSPLLRNRRVLVQVAYGDQTVPNPTAGFVVRAGGLLGRTTMYRNDKTPTASTNPHAFLLDPHLAGRAGGQAQAVAFLASDGKTIVDPDGGGGIFETPVKSPAELMALHFDSPGS